MRNWKKWLSAVLAVVMAVVSMGALPVLAAEPTVLYSADFNGIKAGEKPNGLRLAENKEKKIYARVAGDGDSSHLRIYAEAEGAGGAPRADYLFDLTTVDDLTVTLKAKSDGANPGFIFAADGKQTHLGSVEAQAWAEVRIELDFKKKTSVLYLNGQAKPERAMNMDDGAEKGEIRFTATLQPGDAICYDDIVITTSEVHASAVVPQQPSTVDPTVIPFEPTKVPNKVSVPGGAYAFLNQDFTNAKRGEVSKMSIFNTATPYVDILEVGGNAVMRYWATDGVTHSPRVQFRLPAAVDTYVLDYAFALNEGTNLNLALYEGSAGRATLLNSTKAGSLKYNEWNYVHTEIDLMNMKAHISVNGGKTSEVAIKEITDRENDVHLRFVSQIDAGEIVYIDSTTLYTNEDYTFDGILLGDGQVAWENVKPKKPISEKSYVSNLTPHPRVLVHDWNEMRSRVHLSPETEKWYENIKTYADACLTDGMAKYAINSRGNILASTREAQGRLMCLSFMYKMTGEQKYFDRAVLEMREYGTWPDWSGFVSTLVTAEAIFGYACMYDWLYDDLTATQKREMVDIVKKLGLPDFMYDYEVNGGVVNNKNNWNPVCHGSMLAIAFAFADEEQKLSEYIFERAPGYIIKALAAYAPHGATDEGTGYWDYGTTFLCMTMDMLENGFEDGFELPEEYKYYNYPGVSETGDFPIYYTSSVGSFDYGDASMGTGGVATEALYWLANKFNKPQYAWLSNKTQRDRNSYLKPKDGSYVMAYSPIFALAIYDPSNASVAPGVFSLDRFYTAKEGTSGMSMRSSWDSQSELFSAMQGGYTTVGHMYYSLGTYVIDWDGARFVDEDISTDYAIKDAKEKVYYKRAEAHSTLIMNPTAAPEQTPGAGAFVVRSGSSDNTAFGILDMTATHADYISAKRGMMMTDNRRRVIIQDEVKAKAPSEFYWFANTKAKVTLAPDGRSALLERDGARMLVRMIEAPADARFGVMERKSLIDGVLNTQTSFKLYVHLENVQNLNFAVEYVGLKDGEGMPAPGVFAPMDSWTANDNGLTTVAAAGNAVVLKLDTPSAIAKGEKTYVDPANYDVVPFTENGRTLVPVRFISEAFGAQVGWDDATQTVSVDAADKHISLQIGSNQMLVNGEAVTLDVPANTYNSRTLIPLRALVEALGKHVFWDDRGLIIIKDDATPFDAQTVDRLVKELNVRVTANGNDVTFFTLDREHYVLNVKQGEAVPQIGVSTIGGEVVLATQAANVGDTATVTVDGKVYTIKIEYDPFEGAKSNTDAGVLSVLSAEAEKKNLPTKLTYIYVEDLTDSTGFATFPKRGIVDGVINNQIPNRWACEGEGWIQFDFGSVKNVHSMAFAGVSQDKRAYNFDVEASTDGENWTNVHTGGAPKTTDIMSIISLGDVQARYVRMLGHGNNINAWNTWAEVRFYESEAQQNEDKSLWEAYFLAAGLTGKPGETSKILLRGMDGKRREFALSADAQITYKVADESVATVSSDGTVTYLKSGTTSVKITVVQDGYRADATMDIEVK